MFTTYSTRADLKSLCFPEMFINDVEFLMGGLKLGDTPRQKKTFLYENFVTEGEGGL